MCTPTKEKDMEIMLIPVIKGALIALLVMAVAPSLTVSDIRLWVALITLNILVNI